MNVINNNVLLQRMKNMVEMAQGGKNESLDALPFSNHLIHAINQVNTYQKTSGALKKQYELDPKNTNLVDVMVASQKAGLAFQSMVQVNKRLLTAYKDIMGMPL